MPEATVDEDSLFQLWKNNVWMSRQAFTMKTIAITYLMQKTPDAEFRSHILAANAPHIVAAALRRNGVYHSLKLPNLVVDRKRLLSVVEPETF